MSATTDFSPFERQREAVLQILTEVSGEDGAASKTGRFLAGSSGPFGGGGGAGGNGAAEQIWKVLIYDEVGRDIIAPLMKVTELRRAGVTLHLLLSSKRQPVPDVPAVYFVAPTEENIQRICEDCASLLYDSLYLNFTTSLPRPLLERLAESTLKSGTWQRLCGVSDTYCSYVSLERDLFSLNIKDSYFSLNNSKLTDKQVEANVEIVLSGILSVLVTLGVVPIIRTQRGGPAEMIGTMLCSRIRELLVGRDNIFTEGKRGALAQDRPLLVLLDRNIDLPVMLHHTWTYQALTHDLLGLELNRVTIPKRENDTLPSKSYDLDPSDFFWATNAGKPFPRVAEAVEAALTSYQREVEEVNRQAGAVGEFLDEASLSAAASKEASGTGNLAMAIARLPELRKKKNIIDMHTNIATALLDHIKDRGLDGFFQLEDQMMSTKAVEKEAIISLIQDSKGSVADKLRLVLIYSLCSHDTSSTSLTQCRKILEQYACTDIDALDYVKSIEAFSATLRMAPGAPSNPVLQAKPSSLEKMMSTVVEHGVKGLTQVAQNFNKLIIEDDKALTAVRILDALMENKPSELIDGYLYLDPKAPKNMQSKQPVADPSGIGRKPFRNAILFTVGGGNYVEYQNMKDHMKAGRSFIYGTTEVCNSEKFVKQLAALGRNNLGKLPITAETSGAAGLKPS
eukprot:CAMPEP_0184707732 /NCGR_PEP_ID=MMETSP0313-20130426/37420_1 /TAXON_ID=2792 /ORGANISM="Porphyridium aerugineum, Strain SAG 1380-2" /LENGTH=680 /DNA_ID=CAMNT_0027169313 /DNA_START=182 /DNA_END=2224 /DNA_ORIENTATION=-